MPYNLLCLWLDYMSQNHPEVIIRFYLCMEVEDGSGWWCKPFTKIRQFTWWGRKQKSLKWLGYGTNALWLSQFGHYNGEIDMRGYFICPSVGAPKLRMQIKKAGKTDTCIRCKLSLLGVTMERLKGPESSGVLLPISFQQSVKVVASALTLSTEGGGKETSKQLVLKWYGSGFHISDTSSSAQEQEFQWQNFASSKVVAYILTHPQEKRLNFTGVHGNTTQLKSSVFWVKI